MPLHPRSPRRAAAATVATLAGLAALLLPGPAQAGRAQAGLQMGTYATTDLDAATASGQSWRDGQPLQAVADAALPPDKDWARVDLRVDGPLRSRSARVEAQAQARLRGSGLLFSGAGLVASDVEAGTLALQWHSDLAQDSASPPGAPRQGYVLGYPFAELWETFEVVYPIERIAPVAVTLNLQLSGHLAGNDGRHGHDSQRAGVEAYLSLGGVDTGESHFWLDPVSRSEGPAERTVLSFSGPLRSSGCSVARGVCGGFVSIYAALDLRGRTSGEAVDAWQMARAPVDLAFDAQLSLQLSNGVTLVRGDVSDALPAVAWAQVSSVPEPVTLLLWALGLGGLLVRGGYSGPKAPAIAIRTRHHFRFDPATDSDRRPLPAVRQVNAAGAAA